MAEASTTALSPETVLAEMKKNGVSHIVWLPDSETNWLYLLMQAEPSLTLVGVSREGHACSIASGLAGGRRRQTDDPHPEHRTAGNRATRCAAGCSA